MKQVTQITTALKKCLKSRGMTYAQLGPELSLSEASVKRLFSQGTFTLERLEQICQILQVDFYELARMARTQAERSSELSLEQESALADDPMLLTMFFLVLNGWTLTEICRDYVISETEGIRLLAKLDRLKVIELQVKNRVKLLTQRNFAWRPDGPIRQLHQARVLAEFFASRFTQKSEKLRFEVKELSAASLAVMQRKIERLAAEFNELAEIDASLPPSEHQSVGITLAIRPWVFSIVSALRRTP